MTLRTTSVGSLPKPRELRRARWKHAECEIDDAALRDAESRALDGALKLQESVGLDLWVDGQVDRGDMVSHFAGLLEGLEPGQLVRCYGNRYYRRPRVIGEIERLRPLTVQGWRAAQERAAKPVKAILTGPYTLMSWSFDEHYRDRKRCCLAFAEALRAEAEDLLAAGAAEIQIDEPAIGSRTDEMDLIAEALGRVTGHLDQARVWAHLSYGELTSVIGAILDLPVDVLSLEMANSDHAVLEQFPGLPEGRSLAAGVIDVLTPEVESAAAVAARIARVLEHVPADRLWLTPDAGLHVLDEPRARAKLKAMVRAAASLR